MHKPATTYAYSTRRGRAIRTSSALFFRVLLFTVVLFRPSEPPAISVETRQLISLSYTTQQEEGRSLPASCTRSPSVQARVLFSGNDFIYKLLLLLLFHRHLAMKRSYVQMAGNRFFFFFIKKKHFGFLKPLGDVSDFFESFSISEYLSITAQCRSQKHISLVGYFDLLLSRVNKIR